MITFARILSLPRDRLIGLAGVSPNLVKNMEDEQRIPPTALVSICFYADTLILVTCDMKRLKVSIGFGNIGLTI